MKAIFPCNGTVVVTKPNVDILNNFYEENLKNSKLFAAYKQNNFVVQVGNLTYLPENSTIVLEQNTNLLDIKTLNNVLSKNMQNSQKPKTFDNNKPIEDNFILDHPFFQTLKPLN